MMQGMDAIAAVEIHQAAKQRRVGDNLALLLASQDLQPFKKEVGAEGPLHPVNPSHLELSGAVGPTESFTV